MVSTIGTNVGQRETGGAGNCCLHSYLKGTVSFLGWRAHGALGEPGIPTTANGLTNDGGATSEATQRIRLTQQCGLRPPSALTF